MDKNIQTDEYSEDGSSVPLSFVVGDHLIQNSDPSENGDDYQLPVELTAGENVVAQFHAQVSNVLSDTKAKMLEEAQKFNSASSNQTKLLINQMKLRHSEEKTDLLQKMKRLKVYCESLETSLQTKDELIKSLIGKIEYQQNKLLMSKVFNAWRRFAETKKRKGYLSAVAEKHYEQNLKRRMFRHWQDILKKNWRQHIELQANVEVLEAQKQVVSLYENKIRNLEDSLSEAGRKIDKLLQHKPKPNEDLPRKVLPAPPQTKSAKTWNNNNVIFQAEELHARSESYRSAFQRPETSPAALCSECSTQAYGGVPGRYFMYSAAPPVGYVLSPDETISEIVPSPKPNHPSAQTQSIPIIGTQSTRQSVLAGRRNGDIPKTSSKPHIMVERHLPRNQMIPGNLTSTVMSQNNRNQCHKKIV